MNTRTPLIACALLAASLLSGTAHAALEGRDLNGSISSFEAYYDTDLDITWLADANYSKTSGYDADGRMTWANANTWAANLSFTDGVNVYDNWRLPLSDTSCGWDYSNCTANQMVHLFYTELGGTAGQSILMSADSDLVLFTNIQLYPYWSADGNALNDPSSAYIFQMSNGLQSWGNVASDYHAWAVSPGDVGIAAVPEPETYAMMLAGLGLVGVAARRRKIANA